MSENFKVDFSEKTYCRTYNTNRQLGFGNNANLKTLSKLTNLTNNTIITLEDLGYSWFWGTQPATNPSFPGCKPSVFGTVTVQLFDFELKTAALCPCLLPPNNITSSIAQVNLSYNNTTQVPNANSNPIAPNCTF